MTIDFAAAEPWEAQAFAMAFALHERATFRWPEWAAMLGSDITHAAAERDLDSGDAYYRHWLAAIALTADDVSNP